MALLRPSTFAIRALQKTVLRPNFRQAFYQRSALSTKSIHGKWKARWKSRNGKEFTYSTYEEDGELRHPLTPMYHRHLGASPLDALKVLAEEPTPDICVRNICASSIYDHPLLRGALFSFSYGVGEYLRSYRERFGDDVIRLYIVLRSREEEKLSDKSPIEGDLLQLEGLLAKVWAAIVVAYDLYVATLPSYTPPPDIPAALCEPNLESWLDYITDAGMSDLHLPPPKPDPRNFSNRDNTILWLTTQRAVRAMTLPLDYNNNTAENVKGALTVLAGGIIDYAHCNVVHLADHFHAARTLLYLLAPLVPSFAEEAWVVLLEGPSASKYSPDGGNAMLPERQQKEEVAEEESAEEPGNRHYDEFLLDFPVRGRPETLYSVFDQAFPRRLSNVAMERLRSAVKE